MALMNRLHRLLRRLALMVANLSHPNPSILGPGALALGLWLLVPMVQPDAPQAWTFTIAFCASLAALIGRRCYGHYIAGHTAFQSWTTLLTIAAALLALTTVLLWKQDILWCQRLVSVQMCFLAIIHLLWLRRPDDADTAWVWGPLARPEQHRLLSAGTAVLALMALLLNETMIRFASPMDWIVAWAICPVVLHYANVLMIQIAILSDEPASR